MGRNRKPNLEVEYELERQVKELKNEVDKLKKELTDRKKADRLDRKEKKEEKVAVKKVEKKECPKCGALIKSSELPMGYLDLCEAGCGYRAVVKKGKQ